MEWQSSDPVEEVIRSLLGRISVSSGDDLLGFVLDLQHEIESVDGITRSWVRDQPSLLSMVSVFAEFADGIPSIQDLGLRIQRVSDAVMYPAFRCSSLRWYRDAAVVRFVTASKERHLCVTGTIVAVSKDYPELVKRFDATYSSMVGPLPEMDDELRYLVELAMTSGS